MCNLNDVICSSYCAADEMVSALYEYGGENLGRGIRRVWGESFCIGVMAGYEQGQLKGIIKGSVLTALGIGAIETIILGVKKLSSKKTKQELLSADSDTKQCNNAEKLCMKAGGRENEEN